LQCQINVSVGPHGFSACGYKLGEMSVVWPYANEEIDIEVSQLVEFCIFCSHSSDFQVTSSIISSLNAASVVYYRYQFFVSISFTTFRIMKFS